MLSTILVRLKGWRTLIAGAVVVAAPLALDGLDRLGALDLSALLTPERATKVIALIGVLKIVLRLVTTTPVGGKE